MHEYGHDSYFVVGNDREFAKKMPLPRCKDQASTHADFWFILCIQVFSVPAVLFHHAAV